MEKPQFLPEDINAEVLLPYFKEGLCKFSLQGLHKRNSYNDIISTEDGFHNDFIITLGRNSLYNSLPEFLFHPIDRFDNLPKHEEKERFEEEIDKQEEEKEHAYQFFRPFDILLLKLRADVRSRLEEFATDNIVLQQLIGDELTDRQRQNRFIAPMLHYLPYCKDIRGNRTLLTLLLRKVFMEDGMKISIEREERQLTDYTPHYGQEVGMILGDSYVGNNFTDHITTYNIYYWNEERAGKDFLQFVDDMEMLRLFLKDYFLSVEEDLRFNIVHDDPTLRLSDEVFYNYLNYNTNI